MDTLYSLFLFFVVMFYIEVSSYSLLPSDQGGMSFWMEFKNVWYRSLWFYGSLLLLTSFFVIFVYKIRENKELLLFNKWVALVEQLIHKWEMEL